MRTRIAQVAERRARNPEARGPNPGSGSSFFFEILLLINSITYGTRIHKGSPVIPILSRINQIPRIEIYLIKIILI